MITVDNGPEFIGKAFDAWAHRHEVKLVFNRVLENQLTIAISTVSTAGCVMNA